MKNHRYSKTSLSRLETCEPELVEVAKLGLEYSPFDIAIVCGIRSLEEQAELMRNGKTKTMNSRHLPNKNGLAEAFDFAPYIPGVGIVYKIPEKKQATYFKPVIQAMFRAAIQCGVQIESGGLWRSFLDYPHIQLLDKK